MNPTLIDVQRNVTWTTNEGERREVVKSGTPERLNLNLHMHTCTHTHGRTQTRTHKVGVVMSTNIETEETTDRITDLSYFQLSDFLEQREIRRLLHINEIVRYNGVSF